MKILQQFAETVFILTILFLPQETSELTSICVTIASSVTISDPLHGSQAVPVSCSVTVVSVVQSRDAG